MSAVKEIQEKLDRLMEKHPQVANFELAACGVTGYLNVFYDNGPNNPPTGFSLEDYDFMEGHIENVEAAMHATGHLDLSESEKDYLITSQIPEAMAEKDLYDLIEKVVKNRTPEKVSDSKDNLNYIWKVTAESDALETMLVCVATSEEIAEQNINEHRKQYAKVFGEDEADCIEYVTAKMPVDILISTITGGK